jgi:hypothetical protein
MTGNLKKLDDRSKPAIFIRYDTGSKAYRTYDLATQRVRISRDVVFEEEAKWDWAGAQLDSEFLIDYVEMAHQELVTMRQNVLEVVHDQASTSPTPTPVAGPQVFGLPPLSPALSALDADHDDAPVRYRSIWDMMKDTVSGEQGEDILMVNTEELASFQEAQAYDYWRKAMLNEMTAIEANGTRELVEAPASQRPIGLKWVFKTKKDASGVIIKHKAFLNGDLQEEVFVTQPPGFIIDGAEYKVLRLSKALYGLWQVPHAWYIKLDASLAELGFQRGEAEHAMYTRGIGDWRLIVGIYVDDLIITGGNSSKVKQLKLEIQDKFQMVDLGKLRFYLGLEVEQRSNGTMVSQGAYALKILKAAALAGCNPSHTPMEQCLKLSKSSTAPAVDPTEYWRIVGALRYLVNTRPDLAYVVGYVSRFMENPTTEHLLAVKTVPRYIAWTVH